MNKFITLAISGLFFAQSIEISSASEKNQPSFPTVVVEKATPVEKLPARRYVGMVEAVNTVDIMPRITGTLLKINFTEGAAVKAGDLLYELEDTTFAAGVQALEAQIEAQQASLNFATSEYNRKYKLLQSNVVSTATHEQALMEIKIAQANLKRLHASLTDARNTLSYTKIHTPISGMIGKSRFTVGNLITPQSGAMVNIQQLAPIYVKFSISEKVLRREFGNIDRLKEQAKVQVMLADGSIAAETASITLTDNKINAKSNTVTMWATFQNRNCELLPGSFVTVLLESSNSSQTHPGVLPSALIMENDQCYIWVLPADGKNIPVRRKVKPGDTVNGRQIILEGVKNGEMVVVDGTHKIRNATPVTPVAADKVFAAKDK
ncbi:MAG: efflux RND transporter periplasmic adaptor subunit [Lentisphaerae bacterium]|nr:efflux RND transporter periplasmic adaptor subunit [Lentisphaerota bacterium]